MKLKQTVIAAGLVLLGAGSSWVLIRHLEDKADSFAKTAVAEKPQPAVSIEEPKLSYEDAIKGLYKGIEPLELAAYHGERAVTIRGRLVNKSGRFYSYVAADFEILNKAGDKTGTATAVIRHLAPDQVWKFEATSPNIGNMRDGSARLAWVAAR